MVNDKTRFRSEGGRATGRCYSFLKLSPTAQRRPFWGSSLPVKRRIPARETTPVDMFRSRWILAIRQAHARYRCTDGRTFPQKTAVARDWFAWEVRARPAREAFPAVLPENPWASAVRCCSVCGAKREGDDPHGSAPSAQRVAGRTASLREIVPSSYRPPRPLC